LQPHFLGGGISPRSNDTNPLIPFLRIQPPNLVASAFSAISRSNNLPGKGVLIAIVVDVDSPIEAGDF